MHEFSIAQAILEAVETEARRHSATAVARIWCRIGVLRQVEPQLLIEAFQMVRVGTMADSAECELEYVGMHLECHNCNRRAELVAWRFECPYCRSSEVRLSGGDELELTHVELEVNDEGRSPEKEPVRDKRTRCAAEPAHA